MITLNEVILAYEDYLNNATSLGNHVVFPFLKTDIEEDVFEYFMKSGRYIELELGEFVNMLHIYYNDEDRIQISGYHIKYDVVRLNFYLMYHLYKRGLE